MTTITHTAAVQTGIAALRSGDAQRARDLFQAAIQANRRDINAWLGLARACHALNELDAGIQAVDAAFELEPRHLQALVIKADLLEAQGDVRAAVTHDQAALHHAQRLERVPEAVLPDLARAQDRCAAYQQRFDAYLRQCMDEVDQREGVQSERFAQSLDLLSGHKQIYLQQPKLYYFPGLPQIQFYDARQFEWIARLEAATADIRQELLGVMTEDLSDFEPYVQEMPGRPKRVGDSLLNNRDWSAFHLVKNGQVVPENASRCPRTMAALEGVPLTRMKGRSPSVMFSLLRPGTSIPPHCGLVNTRLICHLPLVVPPDCALRVGNDTRQVVEGKAWVFDDTIEHEAWNRSEQIRVVLLFEIWRPELTLHERAQVSAMFEAIDAYQGSMGEWSI